MFYHKNDEFAIRDLQDEDVINLFSWWINKEINKYDPRPIPCNSYELLQECMRYCNKFEYEMINVNIESRKYIYFIITDIEDNPIGFVNFFNIDKETRQGEMGVIIGDKRYWKRGIATRAIDVVTNYIFSNLNINRVYIETGENNLPALRLFKKVGFTNSGEYLDEGFKFIVMEKRYCK